MYTTPRLARRTRLFFTSPFFYLPLFFFLIGLTIYLVFFTSLIKKSPPPDYSTVTPLASLSLISYEPPADASASSVLHESQAITQAPFQTLTLLSDGQLSDTATTSAITLPVLIHQVLPSTEIFTNLFTLHQTLADNMISYRSLWLYGDHFGLILPDPLLAILPANKDPRVSLNSLQQIRSHSTMKLIGAIVDLRFDNPVIRLDQMPL